METEDEQKELQPVASDDVPMGALRWTTTRTVVDETGREASVRRLSVPGGWLYQITHYDPKADDEAWSQPVFVVAPPAPELKLTETRFATTSDPLDSIHRADVVVDLKSGTVVKNRFGKAFMIRKTRDAGSGKRRK